MSQLDDPGRVWRERSDAARRDAALMSNPAARLRLLEIAAAYERFPKQATCTARTGPIVVDRDKG
jgi:hypothetical protein